MQTKNGDYVFGIDKDLRDKTLAKYDPEREKEAMAWCEARSGVERGEKTAHEYLLDGSVLCKVVNSIKAKSVRKVNTSKMAFKQRENIVNYLEACKKLGMKETDCFVTQDLFEGDNMITVTDQIFSLSALSRKYCDDDAPYIGVKFAEKNKREFTHEQIVKGKMIVPQHNAGSVAIEKNKGTDAIVMYGKVGQEMGKCSSEGTQQTAGSIAVEKNKGTDAIVMYGKVGQEMGKCSSEGTQQTAGSIAVEKNKGTDAIVMYGKVGQEMGNCSSELSQQNAGSIAVDKGKGTDHIVMYGKVGQEMGKASGEVSQQNAGSIAVSRQGNQDLLTRKMN